MRFPSAEKGEARPEVELHGVVQDSHGRGRDVSDLVSVIHVDGRGGEIRFERFHARDSRVFPLVFVSAEGAFEGGAGVSDVDGFFHGDVAPHGELHHSLDARNDQERVVVFIMESHFVEGKRLHVGVGTVSYGDVVVARGFEVLGVGFHVAVGEGHFRALGLGFVRKVRVVVLGKEHQLLFFLADFAGIHFGVFAQDDFDVEGHGLFGSERGF